MNKYLENMQTLVIFHSLLFYFIKKRSSDFLFSTIVMVKFKIKITYLN